MMKSYTMIDKNYAVVTLDDGSTFGQVVIGETNKEIEEEILAGCKRVRPPAPVVDKASTPILGVAVIIAEAKLPTL